VCQIDKNARERDLIKLSVNLRLPAVCSLNLLPAVYFIAAKREFFCNLSSEVTKA